MGVKWVREPRSDQYSVKTESRRGCMQYSCIRVRNHQTFQNSCAESSDVCVQNHQDHHFLINVAFGSDANLKNGHVSIFRK